MYSNIIPDKDKYETSKRDNICQITFIPENIMNGEFDEIYNDLKENITDAVVLALDYKTIEIRSQDKIEYINEDTSIEINEKAYSLVNDKTVESIEINGYTSLLFNGTGAHFFRTSDKKSAEQAEHLKQERFHKVTPGIYQNPNGGGMIEIM